MGYMARICDALRGSALLFVLFYFVVHTQDDLVRAAAWVFACCGHIGGMRGRGKATNVCCVVRMGFLSSEEVTNAQDKAPTPVKPRPSVGRSTLTAVEHDPRDAGADLRKESDGHKTQFCEYI